MSRQALFRNLVCSIAITSVACTRDVPTGVDSRFARPPQVGGHPNAAITSTPCPPTIPAGYELVTCFNFTSIPGVWHGFIVGTAIAPTPPATVGSLSADYLLVSPTGLTRIASNTPVNVASGEYTFEPEFFNGTWIDVLRFVTPSGDPAYPLTLAVAKRALTPALQAAAIVARVEQLAVSGALGEGEANALTKKLENAIALIETGDDRSATNILHAFVNQINALMSGGNPMLAVSQGQSLIDAANAVSARLTGV